MPSSTSASSSTVSTPTAIAPSCSTVEPLARADALLVVALRRARGRRPARGRRRARRRPRASSRCTVGTSLPSRLPTRAEVRHDLDRDDLGRVLDHAHAPSRSARPRSRPRGPRARRGSEAGAATTASASGWRSFETGGPAFARAVRPSRIAVCVAAIAATSVGVGAAPPSAPGSRPGAPTSGASGQWSRTSVCHSSSARNGITGAISRTVCTRPYQSVRNAACLSASSSLLPEAGARAADVPVREVVDERLDLARVRRRRVARRAPSAAAPATACARATIQRSSGVAAGGPGLEVGVGRHEAVDVGVLDEEPVRVPQRQQPALDLVGRAVAEVDVLGRVLAGVQPAHHVGAHLLDGVVEPDRVAPATCASGGRSRRAPSRSRAPSGTAPCRRAPRS